ncbi:Ubiquitin conjugation factor E4 A [Frankliniella fusca]|uniref:Ubiquitin conjugation factor E4 A n=1 Tax=Frankliniella fusca TaxID=407009 RepID=A0AAE1GSJ7_9NEOP|nr:Ubiquitin conjugation factor E4 A [Frankliniella fusca]
MSDNLENNPFFGLFGSVKDANSFSHQNDEIRDARNDDMHESKPLSEESQISIENPKQRAVNTLIENVFCITLSKGVSSQPLVLVEETAASLQPLDKLDVNSLEQALFERLLLEEPGNHVIKPSTMGNSAINHHVIEKEVLTYLFECHKQLMDSKRWKPDLEKEISDMDLLVIRNFATALTQPDLYGSQRLHIQFLDMFNDYENAQDHLDSLISSLVDMIISDEGVEAGTSSLAKALNPVLDEIKERAQTCSLLTLNRYHMYLIKYFSSIPVLGDILLQHSTPRDGMGALFADTLFGAILSTSCLPRRGISYQPSEEFNFDRSMESGFWTGLNFIRDSMHTVFFNLFKNSLTSRHVLLSWIGKCLFANSSRGRLSNSHEMESLAFAAPSTVSDGFMINLGGVLLRLCKPFTSKLVKLLKVDPTYCSALVQSDDEANERWVHMKGMTSETCLISLSEGDDGQPVQRPCAHSFNFVTEMFFMTHRAIDLGVRVVFERMMQLNQELARIQRQQTQTRQPETAQTLRQILESNMTRSFAMRATLLEPGIVSLLGEFFVASAEWLVQVAIQPPRQAEGSTCYSPLEHLDLTFPLPDYIPPTLGCIPEFLVENVACYQRMIRLFAPETFEQNGADFLVPLLSQVLVFMGCKQRMRNPHLRARLAECLESLLPHRESDGLPPGHPGTTSISREDLFKSHPHRAQIVPCLLDVFVGIEVTGESVAFEHKFNYRRPMYVVMDYLWTIQEQKEVFNTLAIDAEANMGAVKPPLFLRFINLLINDAIFLLDDALDNMAQLRNMQNARNNGEWDNLRPNERQQNEQRFMQIGQIARFDNILGKETIHTLQFITTEITSIFCDPTLVDRISSMLNYFLVRLVGPNKKNFKVKDQQDYDFKPADLVLDICRIYINLGKSDEFCLAVSRDGRSYSPSLFNLAEQVLVRIGGGMLIADLTQVASKIKELGEQQNKEEELFADGPEEFYDPLLSTLMTDPVILPSSKTVIDRDTIARHLLSDQTDPFTKAPLTLEQVIPDAELKQRIEAWKNERRSQKENAATRLLDLILWYQHGMAPTQVVNPLMLKVKQIKLLLDSRGVSYAEYFERNELVQLLEDSADVMVGEVEQVSETVVPLKERLKPGPAISHFSGGAHFYEQVEDTRDSVWLVQVVTSDEPLLDDYNWRLVCGQLEPFGVRIGIFDCRQDFKLCETKGWAKPLLLLAMPKGQKAKDKVILQPFTSSKPQVIVNWVYQQLSLWVKHIQSIEEVENDWLNSSINETDSKIGDDENVVTALSIKFTGRVSFGMFSVKKEDTEVVRKRFRISDKKLPIYLVVTPEKKVIYGSRKLEYFNMWSMNVFLCGIQPETNDVFLCSLFLINMLVGLTVCLTCTRLWWRWTAYCVWALVKYNFWLFTAWLVFLALARFAVFGIVTNRFLFILRLIGLSDWGSFVRTEIALLTLHPLPFLFSFISFSICVSCLIRLFAPTWLISSPDDFELDPRPWWASLSRPIRASQLDSEDGIEMLIERLAVPNFWLQPVIPVDYIKDLPVWRYHGWNVVDNQTDIPGCTKDNLVLHPASPKLLEHLMDAEDPQNLHLCCWISSLRVSSEMHLSPWSN